MAIGNFGTNFFARISRISAPTPMARDSTLICPSACPICFDSSRSSPLPAGLPISLGTCMRMMVTAMPLMNPPMTGVEMKSTILSARRK